jgi:hypothetical protein
MFADLAKWTYVDVASKDFAIRGRKQTTSRVAVITGLSRKEVMRVRQLAKPDDDTGKERYNRAARVIAAWRREKEFIDAKGQPVPLSLAGPEPTFSGLVKRFSGDVPVRATLDELVRVGAVKRLPDGKIGLFARAYIPKSSQADKLQILGTDVEHLIATIDHNLKSDPGEPRFQRKVAYDNLPDKILPEFRELAAKRSQTLLESLDRWLAQRDRDVTPTVKGTGRNRAGLGIYYFEEPYSSEDS